MFKLEGVSMDDGTVNAIADMATPCGSTPHTPRVLAEQRLLPRLALFCNTNEGERNGVIAKRDD